MCVADDRGTPSLHSQWVGTWHVSHAPRLDCRRLRLLRLLCPRSVSGCPHVGVDMDREQHQIETWPVLTGEGASHGDGGVEAAAFASKQPQRHTDTRVTLDSSLRKMRYCFDAVATVGGSSSSVSTSRELNSAAPMTDGDHHEESSNTTGLHGQRRHGWLNRLAMGSGMVVGVGGLRASRSAARVGARWGWTKGHTIC